MSKASTNRQIMDAAWDEVFDLQARIAENETLRKARFAWVNPDGRESIPMTRGEKIGLLAIGLMLGLMMGWITMAEQHRTAWDQKQALRS